MKINFSGKDLHLIDPNFKNKRSRYIMQSFLAGIALFVILFVGENISPGAIIAGIAGTTALIFFAPSSYAAHPRRVIGGHMLAIIVAIISSLIFEIFFDPTASVSNFWVNFILYFFRVSYFLYGHL